MLFDFSSIFKLSSEDFTESLNVSIYLGTIYFNIFKNKKLACKINLSQKHYLILCEVLNDFVIEAKDQSIYKISITINNFNPTTKQFEADYIITFLKDLNKSKYKPYRLLISKPSINLSVNLVVAGSINYTINKINKPPIHTDVNFAIRYFKYLFITKITQLLNLSLDNELSQKRKAKYQQQQKQQYNNNYNNNYGM